MVVKAVHRGKHLGKQAFPVGTEPFGGVFGTRGVLGGGGNGLAHGATEPYGASSARRGVASSGASKGPRDDVLHALSPVSFHHFSSVFNGFQWIFVAHLEVIDLAKEFFEASHPQLTVQQGDALSVSLPELDVLLVDVDFLRGTVPPQLLSKAFWQPFRCAAVNALGASEETLAALAALAPALLLRGAGERWSAWRPRPGVLLLGDEELLRGVEAAAHTELEPWLSRLLCDLRRELLQGSVVAEWLKPRCSTWHASSSCSEGRSC